MRDRESVAGELYAEGREAVRAGGYQLSLLPIHLMSIINGIEGYPGALWRDRKVPPEGKHVQLDSFRDYLMLPAREGLGLPSLHFLRQVLVSDGPRGEKALQLVRKELKEVDDIELDELADQEKAKLLSEGKLARHGEIGGGHAGRGDNVTSARGNNAGYLAARLARDHPELSKRTMLPKRDAEHLSIHAAAIEAGITRKPTPLEQIRRAWIKLSLTERRIFRAEIDGER
jgi:hypothetical protein